MSEIAIVPIKPRFKGIPVYMGGKRYIVPSLSWEQFEEYADTLENPPSGKNFKDFFAAYGPVVTVALRRNYPDLTDAELREMLDFNTLLEVVAAIQGASGMKAVEPGEE